MSSLIGWVHAQNDPCLSHCSAVYRRHVVLNYGLVAPDSTFIPNIINPLLPGGWGKKH